MKSEAYKHIWFMIALLSMIAAPFMICFHIQHGMVLCMFYAIFWSLMGIGAFLQEILETVKKGLK